MNKELFYNRLLETLRAEAKHAVEACKDAADYATNEESRAESKWDTQGLEASYLAAGQAGQAKQWADAVEELQSEREDLMRPNERVSLGALFRCGFDSGEEYYFFAGVAGGHAVTVDGIEVTVITPQSELAHRLLGLRVGDSFELRNGRTGRILSIE
ncbi:MAG: transcription elongation factor GreAB [Verrucomicrobia bacterium]|nr:transcription elongation factor GreAB [Verrucomicrobiota bacterium]